MHGQGRLFARLSQVLGAVAQSGSAPRSHRGGQGFKSPQLHREIAGQRHTYGSHPTRRMGAVGILGGIWEIVSARLNARMGPSSFTTYAGRLVAGGGRG